jgi:hypothetical protein
MTTRTRISYVPPDPTDMLAMYLRGVISDLTGGKDKADLTGLAGSSYARAESLLLRDTLLVSAHEEELDLVQVR